MGDLALRLKCFNLIDRIIDRSAVIFVSHSMQLVSRLCNRVLVMEQGNCLFAGNDVAEGIDRYYSTIPTLKPDFIRDDTKVQLRSITLNILLTLPRIQLSKGVYYLTLVIAEKPGGTPLARLNNIKSFRISSDKDVWPPFELEGKWR